MTAANPIPKSKLLRRPMFALGLVVLIVLLLGALWLGLSRQLVHLWLTRTEPAFAEAMAGRDWADPATQSEMRGRMACAGRQSAVRWLHVSGIGQGNGPWSALACAASRGDIGMAALLLRLGDDIDGVGSAEPVLAGGPGVSLLRASPLAHAMFHGHLEMAEWLIARGAQPDAALPQHPSAAQVAAHVHCLPCLTLLKQHGADLQRPSPSLPLVAWIDGAPNGPALDEATLLLLATLGMAPTDVGADGRDALHAAAAVGDPVAVDWLLSRGLTADTLDARGMNALMHAVHRAGDQALMEGNRGAVIRRLIPLTGNFSAKARADSRGALSSSLPEAAAPELGWTLAHAALRDSEFRLALSGRQVDYGSAPWSGLSPDALKAVLASLDDAAFTSAIGVSPPLSDGSALVATVAASHGWVPEIERALRLGLADWVQLDSTRVCRLLVEAALGEEDTSELRSGSWQVLVRLVDAGFHPESCGRGSRMLSRLQDAVSSRSPIQSAQWPARVAAQ